jgi:hypothetical protein
MEVIEGGRYDSLAVTYQTQELARLNDTLKECGVSDAALRRKICEAFIFDSGYFLDDCWFAECKSRFRPGIYFTELDDDDKPIDAIYIPDPSIGTLFHEYAHGAAAWLFDDHQEDHSEIEVGVVRKS